MHQRRCQFSLFAAIYALAATLYTAVPPARADQQPPYSFQAEVDEVQLTFVATDQHHRDIAALSPTDIAVVDNGTVIHRFRSLAATRKVIWKSWCFLMPANRWRGGFQKKSRRQRS